MRKLTAALALVMLVGTQSVFAKDFADVPQTHWAYGSISLFADRGVINGYEDGSFRPENPVTRGEWAKMMCDGFGIREAGAFEMWRFYSEAEDVSESDWSAPYIAAVSPYLTHMIDDYGRCYYFPNEGATREEVAGSLVRVLGLETGDSGAYLAQYSDSGEISGFERQYINSAIKHGLISGYEDGTLRPGREVTRAEAACLMQRTISKSFTMQPHSNVKYSYVR